MYKYYAVGGYFECHPPIWSRGKLNFYYHKIEEEFLSHVLYRDFYARQYGNANLKFGIRLFKHKEEAMEFAQQQEQEAIPAIGHKIGLYEKRKFPYFYIHTKKERESLIVTSSEISEFRKETVIKDSYILNYSNYAGDKYPKELIEEACRPLFDLSWWLVFLFTFYTVFIPILYTLYRKSIRDDALAMLENEANAEEGRGKLSLFNAYHHGIEQLKYEPLKAVTNQQEVHYPNVLATPKPHSTNNDENNLDNDSIEGAIKL